MEDIRLIKNKAELEGTCYFEFLPGPYQEVCWNDGAVFIKEEAFCYLEAVFEQYIPDFDPYEFIEVEKDTWSSIFDGMRALSARLDAVQKVGDLNECACLTFEGTQERFTAELFNYRKEVSLLIADLIEWLEQQLLAHDSISILGM